MEIWDRRPELIKEDHCCRDGAHARYLTGWGYLAIGLVCLIILSAIWLCGKLGWWL